MQVFTLILLRGPSDILKLKILWASRTHLSLNKKEARDRSQIDQLPVRTCHSASDLRRDHMQLIREHKT